MQFVHIQTHISKDLMIILPGNEKTENDQDALVWDYSLSNGETVT